MRIAVKFEEKFYDVKSISPDGTVSVYGSDQTFVREDIRIIRKSSDEEIGEDLMVDNDPGPNLEF